MSKRKFYSNSGVTLLELMMALTITAILAAIGTNNYYEIRRTVYRQIVKKYMLDIHDAYAAGWTDDARVNWGLSYHGNTDYFVINHQNWPGEVSHPILRMIFPGLIVPKNVSVTLGNYPGCPFFHCPVTSFHVYHCKNPTEGLMHYQFGGRTSDGPLGAFLGVSWLQVEAKTCLESAPF